MFISKIFCSINMFAQNKSSQRKLFCSIANTSNIHIIISLIVYFKVQILKLLI